MNSAGSGIQRINTMNIIIKPLTAGLNSVYLDFFDSRAFSDNNPNGPCYCNAPVMDSAAIRQMEKEFGDDCRGTLRRYAARQLEEGRIFGFLAFDGDTAAGWCNAGDMDAYAVNHFQFIPDFARRRVIGKTMSVVCFAIAPEYRGKGIASALLNHVTAQARTGGYAAVEGYSQIKNEQTYLDFTGPLHLYEKAGFTEIARENGKALMRKVL